MRICLFSDPHWSTNMSIIRQRGNIYSLRLEQLIKSLNWVNETAWTQNCDMMICAGDFMDKPQLTDEELTALQQINWNSLPCYLLCGNHESSVNDLHFNSLQTLASSDRNIIDKITTLQLIDCVILFLPYITESDRKSLKEYLVQYKIETKRPLIIISHNDISGINYGGFISKAGFTVDEITDNCKFFLNGHLHNTEWITDKILNIGSLSAHNFTNDSFKYKYGLWIFDTETWQFQFIENPYGFNFYKFNILIENDLSQFKYLKANAVLSLKVNPKLLQKTKEQLNTYKDIILESRIILDHSLDMTEKELSIVELQTDHINKFIEFCKANIANTDILETELTEVCK